MSPRPLAPLGLLVALGLLTACGPVEPCANGSMLDGAGGLALEQEEHALGWGQADCWQCHNEAVLHRSGCTPGVDLAAVQERVETEGLASCAECHGANGVVEADDTATGDDTGETAR